MDALLVLLGLASLLAMVVGLIKPGLVIRWGEKKTRPMVLMVYGGLFIVLLIALGMTGTPNSEKTSGKAVTKAEESQAKADGNKPSEVTSKEPEIKYTNEKARERFGDWCLEHQFPGNPKLSISKGSDSFYETDGKKYYLFTLEGLPRAVDVLVDPYTGDLFFHDIGLKPQPLNKWYMEYRASHKNSTQANNRINDNFEWVEKPSMQNGYIVGKVKNTSKKTFKYASIVFNLSDGSKNRIGSVAADIRNLKPGDIWSFQVSPALYQSMASYELEKVEGYEW